MSVGCKNPCDDIERLKVCGTCRLYWHYSPPFDKCESICKTSGDDVETTDACAFTPSEWEPYWEGS